MFSVDALLKTHAHNQNEPYIFCKKNGLGLNDLLQYCCKGKEREREKEKWNVSAKMDFFFLKKEY